MARTRRGAVVASMLMLIAVTVSACKTPYSTPPAGTPTSPAGFFETGTPGINMGDVANFGTSTALALSGTPQSVATQTISVSTQDLSATVTPTALDSANPAVTASTATLAVSGSGTLPTSAPVGSRPAEWTLKSGEFPYCIARRFDVDPSALLSLNGLTNGNIFYPGRTLKIPQSGSFPGTRALRNHPATYTVGASSETVYSIACLYGDVRPEDIVQANSLSSADADLSSGQSLSIP